MKKPNYVHYNEKVISKRVKIHLNKLKIRKKLSLKNNIHEVIQPVFENISKKGHKHYFLILIYLFSFIIKIIIKINISQ